MNPDRWHQLSLTHQMANIGSEVNRLISWQTKDNSKFATQACLRSIDLLQHTLSDPKNNAHTRELARAKEALVDWYFADNTYQTTPEFWQSYFHPFIITTRK